MNSNMDSNSDSHKKYDFLEHLLKGQNPATAQAYYFLDQVRQRVQRHESSPVVMSTDMAAICIDLAKYFQPNDPHMPMTLDQAAQLIANRHTDTLAANTHNGFLLRCVDHGIALIRAHILVGGGLMHENNNNNNTTTQIYAWSLGAGWVELSNALRHIGYHGTRNQTRPLDAQLRLAHTNDWPCIDQQPVITTSEHNNNNNNNNDQRFMWITLKQLEHMIARSTRPKADRIRVCTAWMQVFGRSPSPQNTADDDNKRQPTLQRAPHRSTKWRRTQKLKMENRRMDLEIKRLELEIVKHKLELQANKQQQQHNH